MNPPTLERQVLIMLAAAAIPLGVGAAMQAREMLERPAQQCEQTPAISSSRGPDVVSLPVPVPVVPDVVEDEPDMAVDETIVPATTSLPAGAFAFVIELDGPHVVLATEVPDAWADGKPTLDNPGQVSAKLDRDALPPDVAALIGKEFTVYGPGGKQGRAWAGWPRIVAQAEGEIGEDIDTYAAWESFEDPELRVEVEEDAELIDALWKEGRRLVIAPLDTEASGTWARLASLPAPKVLASEFVEPEMVEEEVPWAWQDPAVLDWTGGYELYRTAAGEDDRIELVDAISAQRWSDDDGVGMISFQVADPDEEVCEGYAGPLWGAVDLTVDRKRPAVDGRGPQAVFDIDGDGVLDVLTFGDWGRGRQLLLGGTDGFQRATELIDTPFFGCPC